MRFGNPIDVISISGGNINVAGTVTNQQPQALLGSFQWNIAATTSASYAVPTAAESLMLLVSQQGGAPAFACKVTVIGNTTGLVYFDQVIAPEDWSFCPVSPVVDASVTVTAVGQGGAPTNFPLTIFTVARIDPAIVALDGVEPGFETNRYQPVIPSSGGVLQTATISAAGVLLPAPTAPPFYPNQIRLWTASVRGAAAAATTICNVALTLTAGGGAICAAIGQGSCSDNIYLGGLILPVGQGLTLHVGGATTIGADCTYDLMSTA